MRAKVSVITIVVLLTFRTATMAQDDCNLRDTKPLTGAIFGVNNIIQYGRDTVKTNSGDRIIYSCTDCTLTYIDKKGTDKWKRDLSEIDCHLISIISISDERGQKLKGCEIIFQSRDKAIYGINSRNGKIKRLKPSYLERKGKLKKSQSTDD